MLWLLQMSCFAQGNLGMNLPTKRKPPGSLKTSILQPLWVNLASPACRLRLWEPIFQSTGVGQTREQYLRQMLNIRFINSHLECIWFLSCSPLCWVSATAPLLGWGSSWQPKLPHLIYGVRCKISYSSMGEWAPQLPALHPAVASDRGSFGSPLITCCETTSCGSLRGLSTPVLNLAQNWH